MFLKSPPKAEAYSVLPGSPTTTQPWDRRRRFLAFSFCVGVPLLFALAAAILPQDNNWDLRNYHWYNAYALLEGRMGFDMAPAQTPTYYNPLLDVPFFLAAQELPARALSFLLGLLQGCNFIPLFALSRRTLRLPERGVGVLAAAAIAIVGLVGAGYLNLIGTTFYDNVTSLFVLGALLIVVSAGECLQRGPMKSPLALVFGAGTVVGLAVGLKLPNQVFAVGVCFGLLFVPGQLVRRFVLSFTCGLGVIAGFMVTGGWWHLRMWKETGNPIFPYMNHIFRSPWALAESYRDTRFLPASFGEALTFPFRFPLDSKIASEITFTDARVAVACAVLGMTAILVLLRRRATEPGSRTAAVRYLAAGAGLAYCAWLGIFAIYRYITPLEMLAPLLIVACVGLWPVSRRTRAIVSAGLLTLVTVTARVEENWTRKPWGPGLGGSFVSVDVPALADPAQTLVILGGLAPTAFVIPAFPPEVAFLRPVSYLAGPDHDTLFISTLRARIDAHRGTILLLLPSWDRGAALEYLPMLGLSPDLPSCRKLPNNLDDTLELCPVNRLP